MDRNKSDEARMARCQSEQFRKARNNLFYRGKKICSKNGAEMLILIKRRGKFYRFSTSDSLLHISEAEVVSRPHRPSSAKLTSQVGCSSHVENRGGHH